MLWFRNESSRRRLSLVEPSTEFQKGGHHKKIHWMHSDAHSVRSGLILSNNGNRVVGVAWCSWAKRLIFDQMTEVWGKMLWWLTPVFLSCFGGHDKYRNVTLCQTWRPSASFQHHLDFLLWCLDNRLSIFQGPLTHPTTRMCFFSCLNHTQSPIVTLKVCNNAGWGGGAAVWLTGTAEHLEHLVHILE